MAVIGRKNNDNGDRDDDRGMKVEAGIGGAYGG
jgi:hypothetical protein